MKKEITPKDTRYIPLTQQKSCCVPASISIVMYKRGIPLVPQELLGAHLGLIVQKNNKKLFWNVVTGKIPKSGYGTRMHNKKYNINDAFKKLKIPLKATWIHIDNLKTKKEFIKKSKFFEYEGSISPNNKYLVYMSNETGKLEVYVTTFPKFKSKWQISNGGGNYPSWNKDGKELLYISPSGKLISVPVKTNSEFIAGKPKELLDVTGYYFPNNGNNNYDITPDGKRFIFIKSSNNYSKQKTLNIILNWKKELVEKIGQ